MFHGDRQLSQRIFQIGCLFAIVGALIVWGCNGVVIPTPTPSPTGSATPTPTGTPSPTPTGSPSPTPTASPSPTPCPTLPCAVNTDCDDGRFCNGQETCNIFAQSCECGPPPCDPDTEECDEQVDTCVPIDDVGCTSDSDCPPNQFCRLETGQCLPDFTASCVPGAGVCNIVNSTPGCENPECCEVVCALDPACCLIQWTQECADMAFTFSTCLAP